MKNHHSPFEKLRLVRARDSELGCGWHGVGGQGKVLGKGERLDRRLEEETHCSSCPAVNLFWIY